MISDKKYDKKITKFFAGIKPKVECPLCSRNIRQQYWETHLKRCPLKELKEYRPTELINYIKEEELNRKELIKKGIWTLLKNSLKPIIIPDELVRSKSCAVCLNGLFKPLSLCGQRQHEICEECALPLVAANDEEAQCPSCRGGIIPRVYSCLKSVLDTKRALEEMQRTVRDLRQERMGLIGQVEWLQERERRRGKK